MPKPQQIDVLVDQEADEALHRLILAPDPPTPTTVVLDADLAREIGTHARYMSSNLDFLRQTVDQLLGAFGDLQQLDARDAATRLDKLSLSFLQQEVGQIVEECTEGLARVETILASADPDALPGG